MSANIIFNVPGRTQNYMPVDINTSKECILEKYARQSFSTENTWPYASPAAGYYDVSNSDTKLILLNNQMTWSHLRGKTKAKREPFKKDQYYDWVEREHEMKKQQERNGNSSRNHTVRKRSTDPDRHFSHIGCTFKPDFSDSSTMSLKNTKTSSITSSRPRTTVTLPNKKEMKKEEENELLQYLFEISNRKAGLHDKISLQHPPQEFKKSYNINHPDFRGGQRLYMNNLCKVYSVNPLKKSKQTQYLTLLDHQREIGMHDGSNFRTYREYITTKRQVPQLINCGYFNPRKLKSPTLSSKPQNPQKPQYASVYDTNEEERKRPDLKIDLGRSRSSSFSSSDGSRKNSVDKRQNTTSERNNANNNQNKLSDLSNTDYEKSLDTTKTTGNDVKSLRSSSRSSTSSKLSEGLMSKSSETLKSLQASESQSKFSLSSSSYSKSSRSASPAGSLKSEKSGKSLSSSSSKSSLSDKYTKSLSSIEPTTNRKSRASEKSPRPKTPSFKAKSRSKTPEQTRSSKSAKSKSPEPNKSFHTAKSAKSAKSIQSINTPKSLKSAQSEKPKNALTNNSTVSGKQSAKSRDNKKQTDEE